PGALQRVPRGDDLAAGGRRPAAAPGARAGAEHVGDAGDPSRPLQLRGPAPGIVPPGRGADRGRADLPRVLRDRAVRAPPRRRPEPAPVLPPPLLDVLSCVLARQHELRSAQGDGGDGLGRLDVRGDVARWRCAGARGRRADGGLAAAGRYRRPGRWTGLPGATFEVRGMLWRITWPMACRF